MIILKRGGYKFVVLGAGVQVEVQDDEIWALAQGGPVKLGEYASRKEAKGVLDSIISNYEAGARLFAMP